MSEQTIGNGTPGAFWGILRHLKDSLQIPEVLGFLPFLLQSMFLTYSSMNASRCGGNEVMTWQAQRRELERVLHKIKKNKKNLRKNQTESILGNMKCVSSCQWKKIPVFLIDDSKI